MRDIRRPYRNLSSNESASSQLMRDRQREKMRELEEFESGDFSDLEFDKSGKPVMKASNHFGMDGMGKKKARGSDQYDVLKRDTYFSLSKSNQNKRYKSEGLDYAREDMIERKRAKIKKSFIFVMLIAASTAIYIWTFVFGKATITISPKYKDVEVSEVFDFKYGDLSIISSKESLSKDIPKSAPKEVNSKASGEIVIYNNFSATPQKLLKNTRFQTLDGKIFKITDSVMVPGKSGDTPGSVKVKVFSDSYGASYNITPSDFTIPGFKGTPRFAGFYAKSIVKMSGGSSGIVTIVDKKDIESTKSDLSIKNRAKLESYFKNIKQDKGLVYLKDSLRYKDTDNADYMQSSENAKYTLDTEGRLASLSSSLLASRISDRVFGTSTIQKYRIDDTQNLKFTIDDKSDLIDDTATVTVLVTGKVRLISDYSRDELIQNFLAKKVSDFTKLNQGYQEYISNSRYSLSPSWQRDFPADKDRIKLIEEFK